MLQLMAGNLSCFAMFSNSGLFLGKKTNLGKAKGIYILDGNVDIGTIQWKDLRTRLRLQEALGKGKMILFNING